MEVEVTPVSGEKEDVSLLPKVPPAGSGIAATRGRSAARDVIQNETLSVAERCTCTDNQPL